MSSNVKELDAIILGAGFSGMYMLHLLDKNGYSARVFEAGEEVGGTWYWNRYPGAACDVPSIYYCYTFSEELYKGWKWPSTLPNQPVLLKYANYVADKLNLRPNIQFNTRVLSAHYDEEINRWRIRTDGGEVVFAKYFITGVGPLTSASNVPKLKGLSDFKGEVYHTGRWPSEEVDFTGKRVAVIGTGSSGVQAIPVIAEKAEHLTVFQRTPQYVFPAKNEPLADEEVNKLYENFDELRRQMDESFAAFPSEYMGKPISALDDPPEERHKHLNKIWNAHGGWSMLGAYIDISTNEEANKIIQNFFRFKIKEIVKDPEKAQKLLPNILIGARRPILGINYYETYNRDNVSLVDLRETPIMEITEKGIRTTGEEHDFDIIVFATGFDAMTGPLLNIDIRGREGISLHEKWDGGANFRTYLGLTNVGFPNMFTLWGPHSSALLNAVKGIELHAEWVFNCIDDLYSQGVETIEPTVNAESQWTTFIDEVVNGSIYDKVESWYHGTNIEGKSRARLMYFGDWQTYKAKYEQEAASGYNSFKLAPKPHVKAEQKN